MPNDGPWKQNMLLSTERQQIVEFGMKLIASQLTTGSGGNLSIFNREENLIAIKPSGVDYQQISAEDVVIVTPNGEIVEGELQPSVEMKVHLALYHHRPDVCAVIHPPGVCHHHRLPQLGITRSSLSGGVVW